MTDAATTPATPQPWHCYRTAAGALLARPAAEWDSGDRPGLRYVGSVRAASRAEAAGLAALIAGGTVKTPTNRGMHTLRCRVL